jgi:hypothetical protein
MNTDMTARRNGRIAFLIAFAILCLATALALAWVLGITLFFPHGALAQKIVERADLIRGHIDFLMMSQFLFLFALLLRQYQVTPPLWAIGASCFGAFFNPLSFAMRALAPKIDPALAVEPHFPIPAAVSFTATTIGFLTLTLLALRGAWSARAAAAQSSDA